MMINEVMMIDIMSLKEVDEELSVGLPILNGSG
jgi:hypothetical protein